MQDVELGSGEGQGDGDREGSSSDSNSNSSGGDGSGEQRGSGLNSRGGHSSAIVDHDGAAAAAPSATVLSIVISQPEEAAAAKTGAAPKGISMGLPADKDDKLAGMTTMKKGVVRSESYHEQCRVCQQQSDEPLMNLGCRCRGELSKAHLSCIEMWFRTRGSNRCEICQQVAANVPPPESQPSTNYWIWRVDPAFGGQNRQAERERGCFSPLWVAFCILIGGLLLDVLISVSLGVSALPVNIIIGVLIVLGLGTALRLALECCHEWTIRRNVQRTADTTVNSGHHPGV